jgi:catechol 2,3-dioxygenase-like lactoylglutathione lyase family enzyme
MRPLKTMETATMSVELDHIIIPARDKLASARFLASILGLPAGPQVGPFVPVRLGNGVTLDYADANDFHSHHCAFLVGDAEFDAALARVREAGITIYADPHHQQPGELNHREGGRGFYFDDPNGHNLELLTRVSVGSPAG